MNTSIRQLSSVELVPMGRNNLRTEQAAFARMDLQLLLRLRFYSQKSAGSVEGMKHPIETAQLAANDKLE